MSTMPVNMTETDKEKWEELLNEVGGQISMIKALMKMVGMEVKKYSCLYELDFSCDMYDLLDDLIIENL